MQEGRLHCKIGKVFFRFVRNIWCNLKNIELAANLRENSKRLQEKV
jgi:hypothetical protein